MANPDSNRRRRLILLIVLILLILIISFAIYYFYFFQQLSPLSNSNIQNTNTAQNFNTNGLPTIIANVNMTPAQIQQQANENEVLFFAMPFAERFGTFSNQSDFVNFSELKSQMTAATINWVQNTYIPSLIKLYPKSSYYGIETKALSSDFNSLDENQGTADVLVKTQRIEYKVSLSNPRIFYQNILLKLVKSGQIWKVNGVYWQ
ncbi:MAG: hypothetical protein PHC97_02955 [Patescibacteria group bacterium]|nr:hypothetical protein [Patescibacteria group bacterium]